jgi:serine/threonine protein kinase
MTLTPGTRLGAYEIVDSLGAGGMGEVYRARDTRLPRTVAIKVLPAEVGRDSDRRRRFLREAAAVAALSHPHIAGLHDIGEHDGTDFLVLELIDGVTLASILADGRLPLPVALVYGEQIAQALDHAHRHGIVHRDLKPQNVMIAKSGVKLLDFGLARLTQPVGDTIDSLPTATVTAEGTLLGTLPYMSPEQLEGRAADSRADIFAFGATLYEMIAGRRAFEGTSAASIIGAVLKDQPPSFSEQQLDPPPPLERLVRACLEKDRDARVQSAHDARLHLKWIAGDLDARTPRASSGRSRWPAAAAVLAALALLAGTAIGWRIGSNRTGSPERVSFAIAAAPEHRILEPLLSPDGRHLVLSMVDGNDRHSLWLRALDSDTIRELPGTDGASYPFWSPDGQTIAFFARGKLKRLEIAGGTPINICDAKDPRGGTWNETGVILFTPDLISPLVKVSASSGVPTAVTTLDGPTETSHRWPQFLPDGNHFLYMTFAAQNETRSVLRVASLSDSGATSLVDGATQGWFADGFLFFVRDEVLLAQPFDVTRLALHGEPRAVVPNPARLHTGRYSFSLSRSGTLAYRYTGGRPADSRLTWLARDGRSLGTIGEIGAYTFPSIAPDQNRVAVGRLDGQTSDLWVFEGPQWIGSRLTTNPLPDNVPIWSPDSRRIAYASRTAIGGGTNLQILSLEDSAAPTVFHATAFTVWPSDWSDAGHFLFEVTDARALSGLWMTSPETRKEPVSFRSDAFNYRNASLSSDGRWIAYVSDLSGRNEVYVDSFPTPGRRRAVPGSAGGREPRWSHNGKELYYLSADSELVAIGVTTGAVPAFGDPEQLFAVRLSPPDLTLPFIRHYDVARDGRILAVMIDSKVTPASPPTIVSLNATAALRQGTWR